MKKHRTEILILFISSILIAFMVLTPTEEAGPTLVLPAHIQIQGRTLQKNGKMVIESVNK